MYEYKYIKVRIKGMFNLEIEEYHEIIDKYATEGWRLVQIFPTKYISNGVPIECEIIFERKIDD